MSHESLKPTLYKKIKSFFYIKIIDGYFLAQAFPTFLISLGVILSALMLERLLVLLDLLAADSSPLGTFLGLLADLVPHYLGLAIPAALCVAVFSSVKQMSSNDEIDALLSSGISLFRCIRSYIICGFIVSLGCILLYGYIQPYARYDFRAAFFYASHSGWLPHIQSHTIVEPNNHTVMMVDKANQHGSNLSGIFIKQDIENDKHLPIQRFIIAEKGKLYTSANHSKIELQLENGQIVTLNPDNKNNVTYFKHGERIIQQANRRSVFRDRGDDERELTITELYQQMHHHTIDKIKPLDLKAEFHFRLVRSLSLICIPIFATALAMTKKRKRNVWGVVAAAIILVGYDHIQQFGSELVANGHHSALVSLWIPLFIFAVLSFLSLYIKNSFITLPTLRLFKKQQSKSGK